MFNETASVYIAEGDSRICLDHVESTHSLRRVIPIGESLPLYKGAAGKVLLAWAPKEERKPHDRPVRPFIGRGICLYPAQRLRHYAG